MKIIFFGTSNVALPSLEILAKQHEISAVVTIPDSKVGRKREMQESPVSLLAKDLGLKILKPETLKNNPEFYNQLKTLAADLFVVVSYGKLLPAEFVNLPKLKTINLHPSLLPKYRGPSPMPAALLNGDTETGVTIIQLDQQMDHGPILAVEKFPIEPDDNLFTLSDKLSRHGAKLMASLLPDYEAGHVIPMPQNEAEASFSKIISKADGQINWQKSAQEIYNQFRAFYPWPGVWTKWNGKILKITNLKPANLENTHPPATPGTVINGNIIVCGNGTLIEIKTLQLEGKKELSIIDFLNGQSEFKGGSLG